MFQCCGSLIWVLLEQLRSRQSYNHLKMPSSLENYQLVVGTIMPFLSSRSYFWYYLCLKVGECYCAVACNFAGCFWVLPLLIVTGALNSSRGFASKEQSYWSPVLFPPLVPLLQR